ENHPTAGRGLRRCAEHAAMRHAGHRCRLADKGDAGTAVAYHCLQGPALSPAMWPQRRSAPAPFSAPPHQHPLHRKETTILLKGLRVIALGLLVIPGILPTSRATATPACPAGCGLQKKACLQTDRLDKLVCKQDCRANAQSTELGTCMRACVATSRSTKTGC